jgi:Fur family zinc uptake transcriptional regulator
MIVKNIMSSHEHNKCILKAKRRFDDRVSEKGRSIGINEKPILNLLLSNHRIFSAYDIADTISTIGKRVQPTQIYRSLEKLMDIGVVHRLFTRNGFIACYEDGDCTSGQFLICTECDSVEEIESQLIDNEIENSAQENNFSIINKSVEVLGHCNVCQKKIN